MGLNEVKNSILSKANQQAKQIIDAANKEAAKIEQESKAQLKELDKKYQLDLEDAAKNLEKIKLATAHTEAKHILLKAKKALLDEAFSYALKKAISLSKKNSYTKKLLDKSRKELDIKYVYTNKEDLKGINDFTCTPIEISAGLIAENSDKTVRLDYSFETIFETLNGRILQDVAKKMFK